MKKMYSEEQLAEIAGGEVDPTQLFPFFVRKVKADDIPYPLTVEWIGIITEGIFVEGTFRSAKNPLFFPAGTVDNVKQGWVITVDANRGSTSLQGYTIQLDGTITFGDSLSLYTQGIDGIGRLKLGAFGSIASSRLSIETLAFLNGKAFPAYPTDQTNKNYVLKLVNGTLTWVEEIA